MNIYMEMKLKNLYNFVTTFGVAQAPSFPPMATTN